MKITEKDGRFYDENNNSWHSLEAAENSAPTLLNCHGCSGCSDCSDCHHCSGCSDCSDCSDCHHCSGCSDCSDCSDCHHCHGCSNCYQCHGCSDCSNWKNQPESINSPVIGSKGSRTTIYFDSERTEVICGCFRGTLEEFETRVHQTHGDNHHGLAYKAWIKRVQAYRG